MNTFQRAIASNNHGVTLLKSNNTLRALSVLQEGIQQLKDCGDDHNMNQTFVSDTQNDPALEPQKSLYIDLSQLNCPLHAENNTEEGRLYYSYNRPIVLPSHLTTSLTQVSESQLHLISSVLLFNLALTYRSYRYINQKCRSSTMLQEVKVYRLAASILELGGCESDWGKFIMILILNNLANLHYELCDYDVSHYLFSCIKQSVSHDVDINSFAMSFLSEDEWIEMQLNCVYSQIPSAAATA
jgi:hypothetical protein